MSYGNGPRVITNGMVMYLDAANPKSYPGSGPTLYDLSGNGYNGTFNSTSSVTYTSDYNGVINFTGVTGSYISTTGPNLVTSNYTVIGASRYTGAVQGRIIAGSGNNWLLGHWNGTNQNYYANGWVTNRGAGTNDTNWRIYAGTGNISGHAYGLYINGMSQPVTASAGSQGPNAFALGKYGPGAEYSQGQLSFLICYSRVLSDAEIYQNYRELRGRFSL